MNLITIQPAIAPSNRTHAPSPVPLRIALFSVGELYGGVEQFLFSFASVLKTDSRVLPSVLLLEDGFLARKLRKAGFPVDVIRSPYKHDPRLLFAVRRYLKERKIDILHCHGYKATIIGGIAAFFCGVKVVKTEHGWVHSPGEHASFKLRLNERIESLIRYWMVDQIVYVTRDLWKRKSDKRNPRQPRVIPNGISFAPPLLNGRAHRNLIPFRIGIVGRLCPVKGHKLLFDALKKVKRLDDMEAWVTGDGPMRGELEAYVRAQGLEKKVFFLGFLEDLSSFYEKIDGLVMPSFYEGLPMTLLEAMRARVPVVASDVGGIKEVLFHDQTGLLFPAGDSALLASCLERLSSDMNLRQRLSMNAYEHAKNRYGVQQMAEEYIHVYRELLNEQRNSNDLVWLSWDEHRRTKELAEALGARLLVIPRGRFSFLDPAWPILKTAFYLLFHRLSIVLVQNPSLFLTTVAALMRSIKKFRLVQDLHSYFIWHRGRPRCLRDRVYNVLSDFCIRRSDLTLVTNESLKKVIEEIGGRGAVLQDKIPSVNRPSRLRLNGPKSVVYICTYSEDEPLDAVFEAARMCGPFVTVYVTGKIKDPAIILRKPANVVLTDYLSDENYFDLISSSDAVMALTTHEHTLLCGAYEAVAVSKPLILSDTRALRDYFYKGVVFSRNDSSAIAQAIKTVLENESALKDEMAALRGELEERWNDRFEALKSRLALLGERFL